MAKQSDTTQTQAAPPAPMMARPEGGAAMIDPLSPFHTTKVLLDSVQGEMSSFSSLLSWISELQSKADDPSTALMFDALATHVDYIEESLAMAIDLLCRAAEENATKAVRQ